MFKNLTPHPIHIQRADGSFLDLSPDGAVPRLLQSLQYVTTIDGIMIRESVTGEPQGLPDQEDGVYLIVSQMVANHPSLSNRDDLLSPGEAIRDERGVIVGCDGLCCPRAVDVPGDHPVVAQDCCFDGGVHYVGVPCPQCGRAGAASL